MLDTILIECEVSTPGFLSHFSGRPSIRMMSVNTVFQT